MEDRLGRHDGRGPDPKEVYTWEADQLYQHDRPSPTHRGLILYWLCDLQFLRPPLVQSQYLYLDLLTASLLPNRDRFPYAATAKQT